MTLTHYIDRSGTPPGWPQGWSFPGPNPPGWPKRYDLDPVTIKAWIKRGELTVQCRDEYDEPTDALAGHYIELTACDAESGRPLRVCSNSPWAKKALILVKEYIRGEWGIRLPFKVNLDWADTNRVFVAVRLYGFAPPRPNTTVVMRKK